MIPFDVVDVEKELYLEEKERVRVMEDCGVEEVKREVGRDGRKK